MFHSFKPHFLIVKADLLLCASPAFPICRAVSTRGPTVRGAARSLATRAEGKERGAEDLSNWGIDGIFPWDFSTGFFHGIFPWDLKKKDILDMVFGKNYSNSDKMGGSVNGGIQ